jgi:DNA-3-methyladenine glycosylase I
MTNNNDLGAIFYSIEKTLKANSILKTDEFDEKFGKHKNFQRSKISDIQFFEILVITIFFSGFKSSIVEDKKKDILDCFRDFNEIRDTQIHDFLLNNKIIRNKKKIEAVLYNADKFYRLIATYGSFNEFLDKYYIDESLESILILKELLQIEFKYLGDITTYHFLTEIGFNVLKPDIVVTRIFYRLGLISNTNQTFKSISIGREISKITNLPIRYIDLVLVKYGQLGHSKEFGIKNGICLENNPNCQNCDLKNICTF